MLPECRGLGMTKFHCLSNATLRLHSLYIFLALDSHSGKNADCVVLDLIQHPAEHFKGFTLVFLFRIFLRITPQVNSLAQVVHAGEVFLPVMIELSQHHLFLDVSHPVIADLVYFRLVIRL